MKSIKIQAKISLTDIGGHERIYEGVSVSVDITLFEDRIRLNSVAVDGGDVDYIHSAGSSAKHWIDETTEAFASNPDYMLECITDHMTEKEWQAVKDVVTLYNEK